MNKKEHYYEITYIQYVCTCMIVILHSANLNSFDFLNDGSVISSFVYIFENIIINICHGALPVFFIITGILFYKSFDENKYFKKIKSRIKTLIIPYVIWNIIAIAYFAILTRIPIIASRINSNYVSLKPLDILKSILLCEYTPLWYVRNIFILSIFSLFIYKALFDKKRGILIIIFTIIINLILKFEYYGIIYWLPVYFIGAYIGIHYKNILLNNKKIEINKILTITILFIYTISIVIININSDWRNMFIYRIISGVSIVVILYMIYSRNNCKEPKWYTKISFFIYCTHFIVISTFQKIMLIIFGNSAISTIFTFIITPLIIILFLTLVAKILIEKRPAIWSVIVGGRI